MSSDTDSPYKPDTIQQPRSFKPRRPLKLLAVALFIVVVAGTGGYLLGASNKQLDFPPQLGITIMQSPPITTQQPTSSPISDGFVNWKIYRSYFGYSIKYPAGIELTKESNYFDFQLKNQDLHITFISFTLPPERKIEDYIINGFCFAKKKDIRKEKVNGVYVYRGKKVYEKNNICLQATIALSERQVVDIQGKASNQAGIDQFNKILSTFQFTQ
jgi:hypothetical protein